MPSTETVRSEYAYKGRVITLRLDTVRTADGREITREVIEHRGAIAIVPRLNADTILMVRQYRQAIGAALLEVPAGTLEEGETPDACAARELEEEIGYTAGRLHPMFRQYLAPGYSSEVLHTYFAEDLAKTHVHPDEDEDIEVVPVRAADVETMILNGEIQDAKTIAALLVSLRLF